MTRSSRGDAARRLFRLFATLLCMSILIVPTGPARGTQLHALHFTIYAGSGGAGLADGALSSFLMPTGLAFGKHGDLFIADTAGQRIRMRRPDGSVITVAGGGLPNASGLWVGGGYEDGAAMNARFDRPEGLAFGADGALYIADVGNHCIRRLYRGVVSTYAGNPKTSGALLGTRLTATFTAPRSIAIDKDGTMYVADTEVGVRKIAPDGQVTAVLPPTLVVRPTSVSIGYGHGNRILFIATWRGIVRLNLDDGTSNLIAKHWDYKENLPPLDSDAPLGHPYAIVALNDQEIIYTDLVNSSVKYLRDTRYVRNLGIAPPDMAPLWGGNASIGRDGPRYNGPMSAAVDANGRIVVSDTGDRRLIAITGLDRRHGYSIPDIAQMHFAKGDYRIVLSGGSYINYTTNYNQSIANIIGKDLTKSGALTKVALHPHTEYILPTSFPAERDFSEQVLASDFDDLVIMFISAYDGEETYPVPTWDTHLNNDLKHIDKAFSDAGVPLVFVLLPRASDLSPIESLNLYEARANFNYDYVSDETKMLTAFDGVKAPVVNLFPTLRAYEMAPARGPLYATNDLHFTPLGRQMVADYVAQQLELIKPWNRMAKGKR